MNTRDKLSLKNKKKKKKENTKSK